MMDFFVDFIKNLPPIGPVQSAIMAVILIPTLMALLWGAPWVPTPKDRVRKMLELAKIKPGEKLYDLGCGDGRLVHLASKKYQSQAIGLELSPVIYVAAKLLQPWHFLFGSRAKIKFRNMFNVDLKNADVIVCYLMPHAMQRMNKKFKKELKKGTRVISYAFEMPEWEPIHHEPRIPEKKYSPIWVYKV